MQAIQSYFYECCEALSNANTSQSYDVMFTLYKSRLLMNVAVGFSLTLHLGLHMHPYVFRFNLCNEMISVTL